MWILIETESDIECMESMARDLRHPYIPSTTVLGDILFHNWNFVGWVIAVYRVDKSDTFCITLLHNWGVDHLPSCGIMTAGGIACVLTKIRHILL